MDKREKQIKKRILGLERQKEKHEEKIKTLLGRKDTTKNYWKKEVERMNEEIKRLKTMLTKKE